MCVQSVKDFILYCIQRKPDGTRPSSQEVLSHPFLRLPAPEDDEDKLSKSGGCPRGCWGHVWECAYVCVSGVRVCV